MATASSLSYDYEIHGKISLKQMFMNRPLPAGFASHDTISLCDISGDAKKCVLKPWTTQPTPDMFPSIGYEDDGKSSPLYYAYTRKLKGGKSLAYITEIGAPQKRSKAHLTRDGRSYVIWVAVYNDRFSKWMEGNISSWLIKQYEQIQTMKQVYKERLREQTMEAHSSSSDAEKENEADTLRRLSLELDSNATPNIKQ